MLCMFHLCLASTPSQSVDLQIPEGTLSEKPWPDNYDWDLEDGHAHEFVLKSEVALSVENSFHRWVEHGDFILHQSAQSYQPWKSFIECLRLNPERKIHRGMTLQGHTNGKPVVTSQTVVPIASWNPTFLSGLPRPWTSSLILSSCPSHIIFNPMDYRSCLKNLLCS